jgi:hypothetical protein
MICLLCWSMVNFHYRALDRRVQALVPGSILARRPKRQSKRHRNSHGKATTVAKKEER